jgi:hypothetical protein
VGFFLLRHSRGSAIISANQQIRDEKSPATASPPWREAVSAVIRCKAGMPLKRIAVQKRVGFFFPVFARIAEYAEIMGKTAINKLPYPH